MTCDPSEKNGIHCTALHTDCGPANSRRFVPQKNSEGQVHVQLTTASTHWCKRIDWETEAPDATTYRVSGISVMLPVGPQFTTITMRVISTQNLEVYTASMCARKDRSTGNAYIAAFTDSPCDRPRKVQNY